MKFLKYASLISILIVIAIVSISNTSLKNKIQNSLYYNSFDTIKRIKTNYNYKNLDLLQEYKLSENIINPSDLEIVDNFIILKTNQGNNALHILNANTKSIIKSFAKFGRGPNEVEIPGNIFTYSSDKESSISLFDASQLRVLNYNLANLTSDSLYFSIYTIDNSAGLILQARQLDKKTIIGNGFFTAGRIALFNQDGKKEKIFGPLPPGSKDIPINVKQHAYRGFLASKPNGHKIALANRHTDKIEIYDSKGNAEALIIGFDDFEPKYEVKYRSGIASFASSDDLRFGYIDLVATNDHIIGLYSGKKRSDGRANFGEFLHVFNWNGDLIDTFKLNDKTISISISKDLNKLFAIHYFSEKPLVEYDLEF